MYEVELKVRADHGRVRDRLDELGATPLGRVEQEDVYYNAPHRDFADTDEALRIRTERANGDAETFITYKGPLVEEQSKTREEAETGVEDASAAREILAGLGFEPAATVRKERERYVHGDLTVTLDSVDGVGEFVEVETDVDGDRDAVAPARDDAIELLERLGLDDDDQIRTSYLGLKLAGDAPE